MNDLFARIGAARSALKAHVRQTPLLKSASLTTAVRRPIYLKAENLQRTGSFKARGAMFTLLSLDQGQRERGVLAASAGNHGQSVAWAAASLGVRATVFIPVDAAISKVEATRSYGAEVVLEGDRFDDAVNAAKLRSAERGEHLVHAFEDLDVIAGQGTLGMELADELPGDIGAVIVPIGGGGLASGVAVALKQLRPNIRVIGVQAENCSPMAGGTEFGATIADGIAVKYPGTMTRELLSSRLERVVTVSEVEISAAILLVLERTKLLVEGAGAASVAAVLFRKELPDVPTCCILSGGNLDPTTLVAVLTHGLTQAGRLLVFTARVQDRPGHLAGLLTEVAAQHVNVVDVVHHREGVAELEPTETAIELTVVTRDRAHGKELLGHLTAKGYRIKQ
jgi:threonine dehydratase